MRSGTLPIDQRNEQLIIGCALNFDEARSLLISSCNWDFFLDSKHQIIAWCIYTMVERELEINDDSFNLVINEYPDTQNRSYGGNTYLAKLRTLCPIMNQNFVSHVEKLKSDHVKADIIENQFLNLYQLIQNPQSTLKQITSNLDLMKESLQKGEEIKIDFVQSDEIASRYIETIKRRQNKGTFVTSGFAELDNHLTEGFAPGLVSVVAAFTGSGKSSFVHNACLGQVVEGKCVSIASMEMICESVYDRMISIISGIKLKKLIKEPNTMTVDEKRLLSKVIGGLSELKHRLQINDKAIISLSDIDSQLSMLERVNRKPDILYIDLFGKLDDVSSEKDQASRIEKKLRDARTVARNHDVHICCIVQLKRSFDISKLTYNKKVPRPSLDKIKNSGAFAEEADLLLLLHRNKYYLPELDYDIVEFHIAKQRQGAMNETVYFSFEDTCTRMSSTNKRPHDVDFD